MVDISIFVPCYNEEKRLKLHCMRIYHALQQLKKDFELVLVDDGSIDATSGIGKELAADFEQIRYIHYENGPSRRENLGKAFATAHGNIIAFMDLDLSVPLSYLPQLIEGIVQGSDIMIGSRYKGKYAKREWDRKIISIIYNKLMRLYFGSNIADHQCGFKAFKKNVLFALLDELGYDETFVRGWFWDVELLVRAQRHNYIINEFSVAWTFGKHSSFDFKRELRMLPYVFMLKWRL